MTVQRQYVFSRIPLDECGRSLVSRISTFRHQDPDLAWAFESRECWTCHAKPGDLCRTRTGLVAWFHVARMFDPEVIDPGREAAALVREWIEDGCTGGRWREVYSAEVADVIAAEVVVIGARLGRPAPSLWRRRTLGLAVLPGT